MHSIVIATNDGRELALMPVDDLEGAQRLAVSLAELMGQSMEVITPDDIHHPAHAGAAFAA